MEARNKISQIRNMHVFTRTLEIFIYSLIPVALYSIASLKMTFSWIAVLGILFLGFGILFFLKKPWKLSLNEISIYLNRKYPVLEESADLFLKAPEDFTLLEKLQIEKIKPGILSISDKKEIPFKYLQRALLIFFVFSAFTFLIFTFLATWEKGLSPGNQVQYLRLPKKEISIKEWEIQVYSPEMKYKIYTSPNFNGEEGSRVLWKIGIEGPVRKVFLVFNGQDRITMKPLSKGFYGLKKTLVKSGFYQIVLDSKPSTLFSFVLSPDRIPEISILKPEPLKKIGLGESFQIPILASAEDDHGLLQCIFHGTLAQGNGEAVKFKTFQENVLLKEQASASYSRNDSLRHYQIEKLLDLRKYGTKPGDEFYYYITVFDNHHQEGKSETNSIQIQDTTGLLSLEGLTSGPGLKPEFFRSERQIILDSEHLIGEKSHLTKTGFQDQSNNLAMDQKILRMRYSKFLGGEEEGEKNLNQSSSDIRDFSNADKILEAYTDKHDQEEDPGYLDGNQKNQLKAIIQEMWSAETKLRMASPENALPYEYKALVLLKDLQQKSRAFVGKTSLQPNRFPMEKRLSGDLHSVANPVWPFNNLEAKDPREPWYAAWSIINQFDKRRNLTDQEKYVLRKTQKELQNLLAREPRTYLRSLQTLNVILNPGQVVSEKDIESLKNTLYGLLPPSGSPGANRSDKLSEKYYEALFQLRNK